MKYATFNTDGTLTARLIEGLHAIPKSAVKVDEKLWSRLIREDDGIWILGQWRDHQATTARNGAQHRSG